MSNQRYYSIGQMAKLTGVNLNSQRYSERIGILLPAFIDPQSGYRHYTFAQIHIVEAIQLCVQFDIPLNQFGNYLKMNGQNIHYKKLIKHGAEVAKK